MTDRPVWTADVAVDAGLAAALVARHFPDLAHHAPVPFGQGFDNAAFRLGDVVLRVPRRAIAAEFLTHEIAALRAMPPLPLAVPRPAWVAEPDDAFPYPIAAYRRLPGATACGIVDDDAATAPLADALGAFLGVLHAVDVPAPPDLIHRADRTRRLPRLRRKARELGRPVAALLERLAEVPAWSGGGRLLHGDLYARHVLVDGGAVGVIDWGDVHRGDPAVDLSIGWSLLPASAHDAFAEAYGGIDADTWARARFRALHYGLLLLDYGRAVGDVALVATAEAALRRAG